MNPEPENKITEEYRVLHKVAQILQNPGQLTEVLQQAMQAITEFDELQVQSRAGIFLADHDQRMLRLLTTFGAFSKEFLDKDQTVPFGECLCGRAAESGELLLSDSCFTDARHERTFSDMTAHGHYIVPLKSMESLVGIMFLYTDTHPSWYHLSQEVLLSIGGLIADAIRRKQMEDELRAHRTRLEELVQSRTSELTRTNASLKEEISEHKKTQEHLIASREQFRNLNNALQTVREEEKSRISREVHDQLGQALTGLKMDTIHLEKNLPTETAGLKKQVRSMIRIIDETIQSVQQISMELRPPILDAFGLGDAIGWQAGVYADRYGIVFDLQNVEENVAVPDDLKIVLFRIFQECLTNVVRHAKADRVTVTLMSTGNDLRMEIEDNGKGMDLSRVDDSYSLGLIGMRERIRPWGGRVEFSGKPGEGTRVRILVPATVQPEGSAS